MLGFWRIGAIGALELHGSVFVVEGWAAGYVGSILVLVYLIWHVFQEVDFKIDHNHHSLDYLTLIIISGTYT